MFASKDTLLTRPSGYTIARSVRLRSSASGYFSRTPSASLRTTWTWTAWVKRGKLGSAQALFSAGTGTAEFRLTFTSSDTIEIYEYTSPSYNWQKITTAVYRDPSAWYQIQLVYDTTNGTAGDRVKLYVNSVQVTSFGTNTNPTPSFSGYVNSAVAHGIGSFSTGSSYLDGYLTEINFIDGQALTPSSFGETDSITGVWKAKKYSGTYGTNGFYLNFSDNSSNTATTIGKDYSGNGNNWTPNNISVTSGVTYDSMTDVPTLTSATAANYCVGNPLDNSGTLSSGNLTFVSGGSNQSNRATFQLPSSGKFYAECTLGTTTSASVGEAFGYATASASLTGTPNSSGKYVIYADSTGAIYSNGSTLTSSLGTFASGTVLQIAYDGTTGNAWVGKNNTWYNSSGGTTGDPSTGSNPTFTSLTSVFPFTQGVNGTQNLNFGQRPFSYTPPTGFVALNTYNLPASTIKNGAAYMAATTYTGTGASNAVSNAVNGVSFQPDFVWIKDRSNARNNSLLNSITGTSNILFSDLTNAEQTGTPYLTSFNSNGFTAGPTYANVNGSGETYVGWQWKAGGSSSSNTNGSITSTVSVGATQGFSVVTYTGTGANATVGHGLGVAPSMIIIKNRSAVGNWIVYHSSVGATQNLFLNTTAGSTTDATAFNNTAPTSSVFSIGTSSALNGSTNAIVAYCFSSVAGFSKFGSYVGNGSTDGPFIFTGFRPRFVMIKSTSGDNWTIVDTSRNTYNVADARLFPSTSGAEATGTVNCDILSNGFKIRIGSTDTGANGNGTTYVYAAFAEIDFKTSLAR